MNLSKICIIFLLLTVVSCTRMSYRSSGIEKVRVFDGGENYSAFSIMGEKKFYLWGIYPEEITVFIDREIEKTTGFIKPAHIEIEDFQTTKNFLISIFTLGIYIPRNFRIKGLALRPGETVKGYYDK